MNAIKPILWQPNGLANNRRHDPWLVSSMASFNRRSSGASRYIRRGASRFKKLVIGGMLASTAAVSIGLGCLLLTDNTPDTVAPTAAQSPQVASAAARGAAPARAQRD